ncbi:MAG: 4a-hydroxytetrahydrobiopterin dehydratase [Putridiphycobacter sp.]|nr:4a-hydroxytetrahydrobiopterin dehydratase [Putridiphycobacter sp.]
MNDKELKAHMTELDSSWVLKGKFIHRAIIFKDFVHAFSFMTSVAIIAEKLNHHPNWKNAYNKVNIALQTHDVNDLTALDFKLAKAIDQLLKS